MKELCLYCIDYKNQNSEKQKYLNIACNNLRINCHTVDADIFDITNSKILTNNDLVYRMSVTREARALEVNLMNKNVITFYKSYYSAISRVDNVFGANLIHQNANIPIAKTIYRISSNKDVLTEDINYLGGFPVIIKETGGMHGHGVHLISSWDELEKYQKRIFNKDVSFIIREFINVGRPVYSLRSIVIGNDVIFSYKNSSVDKKEFRSNVDQSARRREKIEIGKLDKSILVKSVKLLGLEFGAVDFVYDDHGNMKIFEVNSPFNFLPIIQDLKFEVHLYMVEYLINKAKKR